MTPCSRSLSLLVDNSRNGAPSPWKVIRRMVRGGPALIRFTTRHGRPVAKAMWHRMVAGGASSERLRACSIHQWFGTVNTSSMTIGTLPLGKRMVVQTEDSCWDAAAARVGQRHCCWQVRFDILPARSMSTTFSQSSDMDGAPSILGSMQSEPRRVSIEREAG